MCARGIGDPEASLDWTAAVTRFWWCIEMYWNFLRQHTVFIFDSKLQIPCCYYFAWPLVQAGSWYLLITTKLQDVKTSTRRTHRISHGDTEHWDFCLLYTLSLCFTLRSHGVSPMRNGAKQALAKLKRRRCSDWFIAYLTVFQHWKTCRF